MLDRGVEDGLVGASSVPQLEDTVAATAHLDFTDDELAEIDRYLGRAARRVPA